jgi:hypothetical protein
MSLIFVQSIPRPSALGLNEWTSESGVKLKKTKVGRTADFIRALYSPKIGGLANYISYTPWIENAEPQLDESGKPQMLQVKFEKKWNLPTNFLHNRPLIINHYLTKAPDELSFFQAQRWKLVDGTTVLDNSTMEDEMGYYVMLASSKVANSEREWRQHKWPKAQWFIALENESDELKYERAEKRSKAYAALHAQEMTDPYKRKIVSLLNLVQSNSAITHQQVHNLLVNFIDNSTTGTSSNIDKFMFFFNMLSTAHGREKLEAMWILKQAMDLRIIFEKQDSYTWVRPNANPLPIADRYSEAVDFLLNPKKATELEEIQDQIKAKQNG